MFGLAGHDGRGKQTSEETIFQQAALHGYSYLIANAGEVRAIRHEG